MVRVVGAQSFSPAFAAQTNLLEYFLCAYIHQPDLNDQAHQPPPAHSLGSGWAHFPGNNGLGL